MGVFLLNLAAVLIWWLFGPYSNFSPIGYLDPWFYTGYFAHFNYIVAHYGATYYVSRLPWILPGLLAYKVATPLLANTVLNTLILACCSTSLYWIVYWHYGNPPALLACIALITNPYLISAICWDYPDGPAIAYAFLAMAFFLRPSSGRAWPAVCGGASFVLAGFTNLAAIPMLIGILLIPIWRYRRDWKGLLRLGTAALAGALAATFTFMIFGKALIGTFEFFMPQVRMIEYVRSHPDYLPSMWGTGYAWIAGAYRLAAALFTLFLGLVLAVRRRKWSGAYAESYLCWVATFGLLCLFEFGFHNVGLRVPYVGSYMICPLLVCAGLMIGECFSNGKPDIAGVSMEPAAHAKTAALGMAGSAGIVTFLAPFLYAKGLMRTVASGNGVWFGTLALGLIGAGFITGRRFLSPVAAGVTCCIVLLGLSFGPANDQGLAYVWSKEGPLVFQTIIRLEAVIDSQVPLDRRVSFWYEPREPGSSLFATAAAVYLWGAFDVTKVLASGSAPEITTVVSSKTTFVHLWLGAEQMRDRTQLLLNRGIVAGNERNSIVPSSFGNIYVVLQDVLDDSKLH